MTDEDKARLKAYAQTKKGRDTLSGLDYALGMIALDHTQEKPALPKVEAKADGRIKVEGAWTFVQRADKYWGTRDAIVPFSYAVPKPSYRREFFRWVRLRFAADWQVAELSKRFPSRKVVYEKYQGPGEPTVLAEATLHPLDVVVDWFRFLWPDEQEWAARLIKYAHGYTNNYIMRFPGVGTEVVTSEGKKGVVHDWTTNRRSVELHVDGEAVLQSWKMHPWTLVDPL